MHQAVQAYSNTARATVSPRELEVGLLLKAASKLQSVQENWADRRSTLYDALYYNRKLWTVLVSSATKDDNPLPQPIKQNVANLGLFVFNRTLEVQMEPDASKIDILITINKEVAAGLAANADAAKAE